MSGTMSLLPSLIEGPILEKPGLLYFIQGSFWKEISSSQGGESIKLIRGKLANFHCLNTFLALLDQVT